LTSSLLTKENSFSKNTAFNKNFGTTTGTVLEGRTFGTAANSNTGDFDAAGAASSAISSHNSSYNHGNIANGQTAYTWGNHATYNYAKTTLANTFTENQMIAKSLPKFYIKSTDSSVRSLDFMDSGNNIRGSIISNIDNSLDISGSSDIEINAGSGNNFKVTGSQHFAEGLVSGVNTKIVGYNTVTGELTYQDIADISNANEGVLGVANPYANIAQLLTNTTGGTGVSFIGSTGINLTTTNSSNGGEITITNSSPSKWSNDANGIYNTGNVGVGGLPSPSYKFAVTGNLYTTTSIDAGSSLAATTFVRGDYLWSSGESVSSTVASGGIWYVSGNKPFFKSDTGSGSKVYELSNTTATAITPGAPASASASGTAGEIRYDSNYIYICTATNTWKRVAISTW